MTDRRLSRRSVIRSAAMTSALALLGGAAPARQSPARIAITLDLEMSRNFPNWEDTHWDFEKGNLNDATRKYSTDAAKRVREAGGVVHFFAVGRVFEQPDVSWLKQISEAGHPIGNHTYDHVNVLAERMEDLQYRFRRAPWLLRDQSVAEAIRENIRLTTEAMKSRLGVSPAGFRTPGGFQDGLRKHPAVRSLLKEQGFDWISSLYPPHPNSQPMQEPDADTLKGIVDALKQAQPFAYDDGLVEIPMSPISDIGAFRTGRWKLDWFLTSLKQCLDWTIDNGAVFDFLAHPSCLYVVDPEFRAIDLICETVRMAGNRAMVCDLGTIAKQVSQPLIN
ncbi:MAG: polysaccharide deacetylase family protein [Planctomycetaceae bacterium]